MHGEKAEAERQRLRAESEYFNYIKEVRKKLRRDQLEWPTKNQNPTTKKNGK